MWVIWFFINIDIIKKLSTVIDKFKLWSTVNISSRWNLLYNNSNNIDTVGQQNCRHGYWMRFGEKNTLLYSVRVIIDIYNDLCNII